MQRLLRGVKPTPICIAVWASLMAPVAYAQTSTAPAADKPQEIVISGSRIKRDTFNVPAPLQIIRADDSVAAGFTSTTEVLQGTSVTGGQAQINNAFGGFVTDGGPGANTIGLRGFAPTRSLVLLNGRRIAPSGTRGAVGAADLNVLPGAIVDRIEVLKDGSSSIYGSDAVAGVINVITKRNLTGVTAELRTSLPTDGGGEATSFSLTGGIVRDRAYLTGAYEYSKRQELTLADRDWTRCNTDYRRTSVNGVVGQWGSFDFVDPATGQPKCYPISGTGSNGVTINTLGTPSLAGVPAAGAVGTTFNRWRPNANVTTGLVGYEGVGGGANGLNVRDTFDPRTLNRSLISPAEGHNLFLQGGIDLASAGAAELYFETLFNRRNSSQVGYRQLSLDYLTNSPILPANLRFATPFLAPQAHTSGQTVGVRAFIGFGNDTSEQTVDFGRGVIGLRGTLGNTGWDYDVVVTHSDARGKYTQQTFLTDRIAKSTNVVANGAGGFSCVDPSGGCVAAPVLTPAVIGGQLPADWVNYVWTSVTGVSKYTESVASGSVTGSLFKLPAGAVKGAFGAEFRQFEIDDSPAADSVAGNLYNLTSSTPTRGKDSATDVFAEVEVPVLAKQPGFEQLTFNVSGRWANYKSYGSGSTYKVGALWSPAKWLTLRGTSGTSYRAPALFEQYLGATSGFLSQQNDPCNAWDSPTNAGTTRAANCQAEGLPAGFQATSSIAVLGRGGRETGLKAETSTNNTFGIILQPALPTGWGDLSLAIDRFDIRVDNGVARLGGGDILTRCYNDPGFRASGAFCRLVSRNPANQQLTVTSGYVNLAVDVVRGLDLTARYTNNVGTGRLRVNATVTRFDFQANKLFAEDPLDDVNGTLNNPQLSGNLDINYEIKGWRFYYGANFIDEMSSYEYLGQNPATSTFKLDTPSYITHTVSVGYKADTWTLTAGVRNLGDKKPPVISAQAGYNRVGNAPLFSGYDYVGRSVFLNAAKSF